jgi:anaerobic selenocysteine-containing dehydrogenase
MLEEDDVVGAYGHHWLGNVRPVVAPPEGVRSDYEIVRELARRVGLEAEFAATVADWKRRLLARVAPLGASLEALERGPVRNPLALPVLFADRKFPTATGKVNLIHDLDPQAPSVEPEWPLLLMAISTERSQGSQWPSDRQQGLPTVTVHPDAARGLPTGGPVRLESAVSSIPVRLEFDERQRRDVALMAKGGWLHRGRCANALVPAAVTDAGGGAVYYDTPVRLRPA